MTDFARISLSHDAEKGATLQLYNPYTFDPRNPDNVDLLTSGDEYIEIDLVGVDGPTGKAASARMVKASNKKTGTNTSIKDLTEEEILQRGRENESIQAQFYAELTTGWRNITYIPDDQLDNPDAEAEVLDFNEKNAAMLYKTRPWIREQVDRFLSRKSNFRQDMKRT